MSIRLSIITTRNGDQGSTRLGDGQSLPKDAPRIHALGEVDELNSVIGLWRASPLPPPIDALLDQVQHDLFDLGGQLGTPGYALLRDEALRRLDDAIAHHNAGLAPLKEFILPGGCPAAAWAHLARSVCRRAERAVATVAAQDGAELACLRYLNRLSDLCFVLARHLNREAGQGDVLWRR